MKLENKFYNAFFYPFLAGITLSIIIVAIILTYYSNNYIDKKSAEDLFKIEKKYAKTNINSVNVLISNVLLKVQIGLKEQLTLYEDIASKITDYSKSSIGKNVYNSFNLENELIETDDDYTSIWFVDKNLTNITNKNSSLFQQISIFSQLTQSLYSIYYSMNDILMDIFFIFDETNLFIGYINFSNYLINIHCRVNCFAIFFNTKL